MRLIDTDLLLPQTDSFPSLHTKTGEENLSSVLNSTPRQDPVVSRVGNIAQHTHQKKRLDEKPGRIVKNNERETRKIGE
jgi:hypothetical protein